jgi:hypothetical protein
MGFIARNPKRALTGLAALTVAAGITVGSGAYFEDSGISPNNSVNTGQMDIQVFGGQAPAVDANNAPENGAARFSNVGEGDENGAIFQLSNLVPGDPTMIRRVTVRNTGDADAYLRLCETAGGGDSDLRQAVQLSIVSNYPQPGKTVYEGSLANFPAGGIAATDDNTGPVQEPTSGDDSDVRQYDFAVSLPESGQNQNAIAEDTLTQGYQWIARSNDEPADCNVGPAVS